MNQDPSTHWKMQENLDLLHKIQMVGNHSNFTSNTESSRTLFIMKKQTETLSAALQSFAYIYR